MTRAQIVHEDASDYTITNEIGVTPPPVLSQPIVDGYKAMLQAHKNLDPQNIDYEAKTQPLFYRAMCIALTSE
jgi:hypothetical protein